MTVAVFVDFVSGGLSATAVRLSYLFKDREAAQGVFALLKNAAAAWHERANDREKMVSFTHLMGEAAVDISSAIAITTEDPLAPETRAAMVTWEVGVAEIKAEGKRAASAIEARQGQDCEAGLIGEADESAAPKADAQ